jgi:hypothetical protein
MPPGTATVNHFGPVESDNRLNHPQAFLASDKKVGRKAIPFDYSTGEWDHVVFFPYDTARIDTIPSGAEWWKAFAEQ